MQATGDERKALPHVKDFAESQYPGSIVVFHGAVFWDDNVFVSLDECAAKKLGISENKVRGELIPDYTVFYADDVICAYEKQGSGAPDPSKPDLLIPKGTDRFNEIIEFKTKHIPYIVYKGGDLPIKSGRRVVVVLRHGANSLAILDHKGGETDYNSSQSRARVIFQARRFGAPEAYVVVNKGADVKASVSPKLEHVTWSSPNIDVYRFHTSAMEP
jgi:hypothetical protein